MHIVISQQNRLSKLALIPAAALFVSACGGSSTSPSSVTVTSISPSSGTTIGGTKVTISGGGFAAGVTVAIGGSAATDVAVSSANTLTATTGVHASGAADVAVSLPNGQRGSLAGGYTYVAPQPVTNTPPAITAIVVQGTVGTREPPQFASLDETVKVTATVSDAETPISQLVFAWASDSGGTFTGSGTQVTWTAPHTLAGTPKTVALTLTVTEHYQTVDGSGLPVTRDNNATQTSGVRVHDSVKEVNDLAVDFLVSFSKQLDPAYVVRNFSDGCGGKADEQQDVQNNNNQNVVTAYTIGSPQTTIKFTGKPGCPFRDRFADACAQVPVEWHSTSKSTGVSGVAKGTDQVTAVLESDQWRLCASDFNGDPNQSDLSRLLTRRYR